MNRSQASILRRTVSATAYEDLCSLWRQLANRVGQAAVLITDETILSSIDHHQKNREIVQFHLLLNSEFNALLLGERLNDNLGYQITLTWDNQAIEEFMAQLQQKLSSIPGIDNHFTSLPLAPTTQLQTFFLIRLLDILAPIAAESLEETFTSLAVCQPLENALRQQIAQERLLNQVIAQIRQSLEVSVILETAVREVRSFLQVDRLAIYEFAHEQCKSPKILGRVTYESRISLHIPSLLNLRAEDDCFTQIPHYQKKYRKGLIVAIEDVETAYSSSFCLVNFLQQYWIRAKLIAPIVVKGNLWGLLIAHQCFQQRHWFETEKNLLRQIGEHLAIAIYQAQLYSQVQEQKKSFEQRVIERTQELRDTLLTAQSASQSKSEFLGNMSHELRTPLTCVIGLSGTLLHWSGKNQSLPQEKQWQYLQTIQDSGKHLLEVINDILEFSQLEAGKSVLAIQQLSLKQTCQNAIELLKETAKQRMINLTLDVCADKTEEKFLADPEKLQQILYHLLSNALKFTPTQGTVILRVWREGNQAILQVEDTGIGISPEHLPRLFESFQQLEHSRQRTYGGTGLGLALTKQLVELHGGTIEVDSSIGEGSIFTIRLPNHSQRHVKSALVNREGEEQSYQPNHTIVLVETDEEVATLICELLTAANYQIIWLIDSATAFKQIKLLQPSVVILDRDLNNACNISDKLKQSELTKTIKILLLSQQLSSDDWQEISQHGIDDYLLKPIQPNLLLQRIQTLTLSKQ